MKCKCLLFIGLAFVSLLLSACQPQIPTNISVPDNPSNTSNQPALVSSESYITIHPNEVSLYKTPQGGEGKFRLLVVVADDQGHSGGMFCPGTNTLRIHNGETLIPCQTAISLPSSLPKDRLYVLLVGVNEKNQSDLVDVGTGALSGLLARGISKAIGISAIPTGPAGFVAGLAIDTIIGYAGGKAADWAQQNEILGSQTYVLERGQNWYAGRKLDSDSQESGMHFSFTVEVSDTARGELVQNENSDPNQPNQIIQSTAISPIVQPTKEPVFKRPDPQQALYAYYDNLNNSDYQSAWDMLSDHFIQKNNSTGYGPYADWFKTIRETRINWMKVDSLTENFASYQLELSYYYKNGQIDTCDILQIIMVFETNQKRWLLDDWTLIDGSCTSSQ